jgi:hypothetical protein
LSDILILVLMFYQIYCSSKPDKLFVSTSRIIRLSDTNEDAQVAARILDGRTIGTRGIVQYRPFLVAGEIIERTNMTTTATPFQETSTQNINTQTFSQAPTIFVSTITTARNDCQQFNGCSGHGICTGLFTL